jgi:16S rRNA (guanine527-N7)-methyltransferase
MSIPQPSTTTRYDTGALESGARRLGLSLTPAHLSQLLRYHALLADWNQRVNLTSVVAWDAAMRTHFLDSLTVTAVLPPAVFARGAAIDVGSGAGFPGAVLAVLFPGLSVTLLEATGKKVRFLEALVAELGLRNVRCVQARAEDLAHDPTHRGRYDIAFARALAGMPALAELCLPFVRIGGLLVAQKKGTFDAELDSARYAIQTLGGEAPEVRWLDVPELGERRALVVVKKLRDTPPAYPRRSGVPANQPLLAPARGGVRP